MELVNKFDNALAGVAGDSGSTGAVVNSANRNETGKFWHMETCSDGHPHVHDKNQLTADGEDRDALVGNGFNAFAPAGTLPVYPAAPHCNTKGLTDLGEYTVRRMIDKKMIIDPDHMSVIARKQTMALIEAEKYSGVVSSHSWSTPDVIPRIYKLGGFVTPYAGSSTGFVDEWRDNRKQRSKNHFFGFGYGADMNGFGSQGGPRNGQEPGHATRSSPSTARSRSTASAAARASSTSTRTASRTTASTRTGSRTCARSPASRSSTRWRAARRPTCMMWERAARRAQPGVPLAPRALLAPRPGPGEARPGPRGVPALSAGQPTLAQGPRVPLLRGPRPQAQAWSRCSPRRGKVGLIASAPRSATPPPARSAPGDRSARLRGKTKRFGKAYRIRRAGSRRIVYRVRKGKIRYVAVATKIGGQEPASGCASYLRLAGLR